MLLAVFAARTVNLSEIATTFDSKADRDSRYKRIQRFFRFFIIDYAVLAKWIFKLFHSDKKIYLAIDGTNWFWGKAKINILTLGIAYEGVAIPLMWTLLDKAGNATAAEHQTILQRFVNLFGKECLAGVLGDREFASGSLFRWLNKNNIPFYIRIKDNSKVKIKSKEIGRAKGLFCHLNPKQKSAFGMDIMLFGEKVYLAGSRSERGELMVVAPTKNPEMRSKFICVGGKLRRYFLA